MSTYYIVVRGIVQGVGFRPFIKNLADSLWIKGSVINSTIGVEISVNCDEKTLKNFIDKIYSESPKTAYIISVDFNKIDDEKFVDFAIQPSVAKKGLTLVPADLAICEDCLKDILDKDNRRYFYPFTNCTNCGPRYSIVKHIPYDRKNTTMANFIMCADCKNEYQDNANRRFHAEPNACEKCGPKLTLLVDDKVITGNIESIKTTANFIDDDKIVAVKGLGGYHLICSAYSDKAVQNLRDKKQRQYKPFAVMVKDIETLKRYATLTETDIDILRSSASPILILDFNIRNNLSKLISPTVKKIGVMLAYTPLHRLILESCKIDFIVATSGNLFDEPIISDNLEAREKLSIFTNIFLEHDRDIYTRLDDSVVTKYLNDRYLFIRRSRGYSPEPKYIGGESVEIFAAGANLKSSFALYKSGYVFTSQYLGDLDNVDTCNYYDEVYKNLSSTYNIVPKVAVTDLHDDFYSTKFAEKLGIEVKQIQHHVAHFLAVLSGYDIQESTMGLILDGFGLGADNAAWGGEIFIKTCNRIRRIAHLKYYSQVGMDLSAKKPSVMLISYLHSMGILDKYKQLLSERLSLDINKDINIITKMVDKQINSISTSSAGRLFEAVGALVLSDKVGNEYEGDLAIRLENIADSKTHEYYNFTIDDGILDFKLMFEEMFLDIEHGIDISKISAKFHNGFAKYISAMVIDLAKKNKIKYVALSGGVFQNTFLLNKIVEYLSNSDLVCLLHKLLPVNDGCIAMGQIFGYIENIILESDI